MSGLDLGQALAQQPVLDLAGGGAGHGVFVDEAEGARALVAGDAVAAGHLERYVDRLARALAHVVNILDPDAIVLGGGLSNLPALYDRVPERWGRYVFSDRVDTRLLPPRHGDSSGVRGAAWLWRPDDNPPA